jgi:PGF-CTERM protein
MTGETASRQVIGETQSRRELLQQLGVTAVSAGAVTVAGAGTARAQSNFEVEITDHPEEMVAGESEQIRVRVENTGDSEGSQFVRANFGADRERVELGSGDSTTITLTIDTSTRDAGNNLVEVTSRDDDDGVRVDMLTPPYFVVTVVETNGPVVEGRDIQVTYEVENTGEADGSTTLVRRAEEKGTFGQPLKEDETGVNVSGESTSTQTFTVETEPSGRRIVAVTIAGADAQDSVEVEVIGELPPTFEVDIVEVGETREGEALDVTIEVTNVGHSEGTKEVTLDLGSAGATSTEVTADEAQTVTETVSIPTAHGSAGENTLTVRTEDDEVTGTVELGENAFFEVDLLEHNSPIPQEFDFEFQVEVTNSGGVAGEGTVSVDVTETGSSEDDEELQTIGSDSASVELESGESTTVDLAVGVGSAEFDTYQATIDSGDERVTQEIEVTETGFVEITDVTLNTPVEAGEEIEVTTTLTNVGSASATESFSLTLDEIAEKESTVVLDVDESAEESFAFTTSGGDAGDHTLRLATDSASTTQEITINEAQSEDSDGGDESDNSAVEESDDSAPGFGVGTALASLGGAGYLLKRRLVDDEPIDDEE